MRAKTKQARRRNTFAYARLIHIYTSTLLFGLVVFFCITGITLNHRWYGSAENIKVEEFILTEKMMNRWGLDPSSTWQPDLTGIGAFIVEEYGFPHAHSIDIDHDMKEVILDFKVPAGFASVTVIAPEKIMIIEIENDGMQGVLNDLHKGRHSGQVWFWLIDISAALMTLFAITGMVIVFQGKNNRRSGLVLAFAGLITPALIFLIFVPSLGV